MMALERDAAGYYVLGVDENGDRIEKRYAACTSKSAARATIAREANLDRSVPFGVALSRKTLTSYGRWIDDPKVFSLSHGALP